MLQRDPGYPKFDCVNSIDATICRYAGEWPLLLLMVTVIMHKCGVCAEEVMLFPDQETARARIRDVVLQDVHKVYPSWCSLFFLSTHLC